MEAPEAVHTMWQRSPSQRQMSSERSYVSPLSAQRPLRGAVLLQIHSRIVKRQLNGRGFPIDIVSSMSFSQESAWLTKVTLCGHDTAFKLDTGAEVTAVSQETHQRLGKPPLQTPEKLLCGPSGQPLPVMGQFLGQLTRKEQVSQQQVCVIKGLKTNLLGLPAITALNLAARVDSANCKTNNHQRFPKVFGGLENLEEFKTRLKPDTTSCTLFTSQYIPWPLQPMGVQVLEPIGVIPKVEESGRYGWPDKAQPFQEREMWHDLLMTVNVLAVNT